MIEACSLSSGSNGNAFFIKTGDDIFLVDAGISCKQTTLRLQEIGFSLEDLSGIFITHEHQDHVKGLRVILKKYKGPVFISQRTVEQIDAVVPGDQLKILNPGHTCSINGTQVQSLSKSHDAVEPSLFNFFYKGKFISVITDLGYPCKNVIESVQQANLLFLESNYDDHMLANGPYPSFLKKRIAGKYGHLSNTHTASLVLNHGTPELEYIFLSHLSENNNNPSRAINTFISLTQERKDLGNMKTLLTSRHEVSSKIQL